MALGKDAQGWTTFTHTGADKIIYVSTSGSDSNDGLTVSTPKQHLQQAFSSLTSGNADWLLLKMGDVWTDEKFTANGFIQNTHGRSQQEPMVIGSYDPAFPGVIDPVGSVLARPIVKQDLDSNSEGGAFQTIGASNSGDSFAIVGIDFYAHKRDPANTGVFNATSVNKQVSGINLTTPFTSFLIEDCMVRFFVANAAQGSSDGSAIASNLTVRRCVIVDNYTGGVTGSQGFYHQFVENVLFEDNVFDHNGWNETVQIPATVTISFPGGGQPGVVNWPSHPFAAPYGGNASNYPTILFYTNGTLPSPLIAGVNDVDHQYFLSSIIDANHFTVSDFPAGSAAIVTTSAGSGTHTAVYGSAFAQNHNFYFGDSFAAGAGQVKNVVVQNNISARASSHGLQQRPGGTCFNNLFCNNSIAYFTATHPSYIGWNVVTEGKDISSNYKRGWGMSVLSGADGSLFENNIVANLSAATQGNQFAFEVDPGLPHATGVTFKNNRVNAWSTGTTWGTGVTFIDQSGAGTITSGNLANDGSFPDGTRTVARYASEVVGLTGTVAAFMTEARKQCKQNWRLQYTADGVNNWIREGLGMKMSRHSPLRIHA